MYKIGKFTAELLGRCVGKATILLPEKGFSQQNIIGRPLYDEKANQGFIQGVEENLCPNTALIKKNMHINDDAFANEIVNVFFSMKG
jgi:uncharacterized protein (UPF0261 family)